MASGSGYRHQGVCDGTRAWIQDQDLATCYQAQCPASWQQGMAKCHNGGWGGNRAGPHGTREAELATGSGHMSPGWLYGYSARQHGTRVAVMVTGPGHMPPGRLRWQQGLSKWHQGGWDCDRV